jgi:4-amino-4-deoxy-L-arabinose transferase-like glycosyltransferase
VVGSTVVGLTGFLFFFLLLWGYLDARREPILWVVLFAYAVRTIVYALHRAIMPHLYTERLYPFEPTGWTWASEGIGHVAASFTFGADFYSWLISVVYLVVPRSSMFIAAINIFLSSAVVYVVYRIVEHYAGHRTGKRAALIMALFPVTLLQTIILSREIFITFFLAAACLHLIKFSDPPREYRRLAYALLCLGAASAPHTGIMVSVLFALILVSAYAAAHKLRDFYILGPNTAFSKQGLLTVVSVSALSLAVAAGFRTVADPLSNAKIYALLSADNPLNPVVEVYQAGNRGRAGYPAWLSPSSFLLTMLIIPVRVLYFLFSPFVWMVSSLKHVAGLVNGILMIPLCYYSFSFFRGRITQNSFALLFIALLICAFVLAFSFGVKNFGQAFRHRAKILPLLVAVGMVAFETRRRRQT